MHSPPAFRLSRWNATAAVSIVAALVALVAIGCSGPKKRPGVEGYNSLIRAQQEALALEQMRQPSVFVHGQVRSPIVIWRDGITLAEALLEAGPKSAFSPRSIRVVRQGRLHPIDVRRLLRGTDNPVLEPGDVVEVVW